MDLAEPSRVATENATLVQMANAAYLNAELFDQLASIKAASDNLGFQDYMADRWGEIAEYKVADEEGVPVALLPISMPLDINGDIRIQGDEAADGMRSVPGYLFVVNHPDSGIHSYIIARSNGEPMSFGRFPSLGEVDSLSVVVTPSGVQLFPFVEGKQVGDFDYSEHDAERVLFSINGSLLSKHKRLRGPHERAEIAAFQARRAST